MKADILPAMTVLFEGSSEFYIAFTETFKTKLENVFGSFTVEMFNNRPWFPLPLENLEIDEHFFQSGKSQGI